MVLSPIHSKKMACGIIEIKNKTRILFSFQLNGFPFKLKISISATAKYAKINDTAMAKYFE